MSGKSVWAAAAVVVVLAVGAVAYLARGHLPDVRSLVVAQLENATGRDVAIGGVFRYGLSLRPRILAETRFDLPGHASPSAWTAALSRGHVSQGETAELVLAGALAEAPAGRRRLGRVLILPSPLLDRPGRQRPVIKQGNPGPLLAHQARHPN